MRTMIQPGNVIDAVSPTELTEWGKHLEARFNMQMREQYRGMKITRIPQIAVTATGTSTQLGSIAGGDIAGPESGYLWRVSRITVTSTGTDNATASFKPTPSQPAVPASTVAQQNPNGYPVNVVISGGTITAVTVNGVQVGTGAGTYLVSSGGTIAVTYSVAPTWVWSNASNAVSLPGAAVALYVVSDGQPLLRNLVDNTLQVGQAYYPSSRGLFMQPGEGLLAVIASTAANTYYLNGQAVSVPAEMQGKVV